MEQIGKNVEFAGWLESFAKRLLEHPENVSSIVVAIGRTDDSVETGYWNCCMLSKLMIAGVIQQDAMIQTLSANADNDVGDEE